MSGRTNPLRAVHPHPTDPTLALVELTRGMWALIDAADATAVGEFNWSLTRCHRTSYARCGGAPKGCRSLHRFIGARMGLWAGDIDHKNGNGLDCRRANLRAATKQENLQNMRLSRANTSGVKGVIWHKDRRKWVAQIGITKNGRRSNFHVGSFDSIPEASAAVTAARARLHGEFANHGEN
jgi:hypothetical protein